METCVLIPSEFSLVLRPHEQQMNNVSPVAHQQHNGSFKRKGQNIDKIASKLHEMSVCVWSNQHIRKGTCFLPFQGTIRLDRLEVYSLLDDNDVSQSYDSCVGKIPLQAKLRSDSLAQCGYVF